MRENNFKERKISGNNNKKSKMREGKKWKM
jgi:hypothetical protein